MSRYLRYKPELSRDTVVSCQTAFKSFAKDKVLTPADMIEYLKLFKFDETDPEIYDIIAEFDNGNTKNGMSFNDFIDGLNEKLQDRESEKAISRVFTLFTEDPKGAVNYEVLKKVTTEVGDSDTPEETKKIIEEGASNQKDIPYEEFQCIMTKNVSL